MKKIIVSLLLLSGICINIQAQSLFNPSFETWSSPATYGVPDTVPNQWWGWYCNTAHQTTDAYQGTFATRIQGFMSCGIAQGILVNGQAPADGWSIIESGTPISSKPMTITGFYKFTDAEPADMGEVTVILKRYNSTTMQRDTVGYGVTTLPPTASYAMFNVSINDMMPGTMPDSIIIMFNSSKNLMWNSTTFALPNLYIDKIIISEMQAGIEENSANYLQTNVFPNPFNEQTTISILSDIKDYKQLHLNLFDQSGRIVRSIENIKENNIPINSSGLSKGNYFYSIQNADQTIAKGKLIIQ